MPTEWKLTITADAEVVHPDGTTDADDELRDQIARPPGLDDTTD